MPNPGGIQLGCEICRQRRIKCDRSQPECRRCIKYGAACPGYPREQDVRFRHETSKILRKAGKGPNCTMKYKTPQEQSNSAIANPTPHKRGKYVHSQPPSPVVEATTMSTLLAGSVNVSWDAVLTQYFFDQMVMSVGWYSYLPRLYYRSPPAGCVRVTVTAAALSLAGNQFHDPLMLQRATYNYGAALHTIKAALAHPRRCIEDETLFAILLLNVLDDLIGTRSFTCCSHHLNGCAVLIKLRDSRGFHTEFTPHLAHSLVIQTQQQLMQGRRPEVPILNDESFLSWLWTQSVQSPSARMSALSLEIGKIKEKAARVLSEDYGEQQDLDSTLRGFVEDMHILDKDMLNWHHASDGSRWNPKSTTADDLSGEETHSDYYSDVQVSKVWNHWRVARIILHDACVDVVERLQLHASQGEDQLGLEITKQGSLTAISETLSDVFASIPFHMQEIDSEGRRTTSHSQQVLGGSALVWPLQMILRSRWTPASQRKKAIEILQKVGRVFGVKQALVYVEELQGRETALQPPWPASSAIEASR